MLQKIKIFHKQYFSLILFFGFMFYVVIFNPSCNVAQAQNTRAESKTVARFDGGLTIYRYVDYETMHVCYVYYHQIECVKF